MRVRVKLPSDLLIDYWAFCKAITQAVYPTGEEGLEGIDCIVGKLVTFYDATTEPATNGELPPEVCLQSVLISEDGRLLEQLLPDQESDAQIEAPELFGAGRAPHQVVEMTFRLDLTEDDRRVLCHVLEHLPPLRYPMPEGEAAAFMEAYCNFRDRPAWKPVLVTEATVEWRKPAHAAVMRRHQSALQDEVVCGRLSPVDANHVPVAKLCVGSLIPRDQAIAYLERCGLAHVDMDTRCDGRDAISQELDTSALPSAGPQSGVGKRKLRDKDRPAIVARRNELKAKGFKDFCKRTAEEFGVSERYVRELAKAAEIGKAEDDARIDQRLVVRRR